MTSNMNNTRIFKTSFASEDELMQKIRYLDKLIDELSKGKTMEKIFRNKN